MLMKDKKRRELYIKSFKRMKKSIDAMEHIQSDVCRIAKNCNKCRFFDNEMQMCYVRRAIYTSKDVSDILLDKAYD